MGTWHCYRCGREFSKGEGCHFIYIAYTNKLVPVCRDDRLCERQKTKSDSRRQGEKPRK